MRVVLTFLVLAFFCTIGYSQVSITSSSAVVESFTGFNGSAAPTNWTIQGTGTGGSVWRGSAQSTGTSGGWYGSSNMSFLGSSSATNGNATWLLQNNSGTSITGFTIQFTGRLWRSGTASPSVTVSWSNSTSSTNPSAGTLTNSLTSCTFNDATTNISTGSTLSQSVTGLNISNGDFIFIRFIHVGGSNSDNLGWDDVSFTPTISSSSPTITTSGTLSSLSTTYGTSSSTTSFSVSGSSLTNNISISAPSGFEISTTVNGTYSNSLTLTQSGGSVSSTTIFVRLTSTATPGNYSGNIQLTSTGATSVNVATNVTNTVNTKALTITGLTADNKVYDATNTATLSGSASLSGIVGSDVVTISGTPSSTFNNSSVGTSKPITVTGYTLTGTNSSNYTLTQPSGLTANITSKSLTISGATASDKTYDGTNTASVNGTLVGVVGSDILSLSGTFASTNAGTGISVIFTISGTNSSNYTIVQPNITANINKANQTITFNSFGPRYTTDANFSPGATTTSGLVISYSSSNTSVAILVGSDIDILSAGTSIITASQSGDINYNPATSVDQTLTVTTPPCTNINTTSSTNFTSASLSNVSNLTISSISQYNNNGTTTLLTSTSASSGYTGSSGGNNAGMATFVGTISTNSSSAFTFTITPDANYRFTLTGLSFGTRSTSTGPISWSLRSSADGFTSNIATGNMSANSTWSLTSSSGLTFNSTSSVTFRLYGHDGTGSPGANSANWRIDDLTLSLNVTNLPSNSTVGSNQTICSLTSSSLGGNTPSLGTGTWSQISGPGTTTFSSINSGTSTATSSTLGTYTYRWSISTGCETVNSSDITVKYETNPTITLNPQPVTEILLTNVDFSASATEPFVWQYSSDSSTWSTITITSPYSTTGDTLTISNADETKQGFYRILSSNTSCPSTPSAGAKLTLLSAPLPVTLVSFKSDCETRELKWITASETNNHFFIVQGTNDGITFTNVDTLLGAGFSNQLLTYTYSIGDLFFDYYRLKQVDYDGKFEIHYMITGCKLITDSNIILYPNPNNGKFLINHNSTYKITVFDSKGVLVHSEETSRVNFDFSEFKDGIYIILLTNYDKEYLNRTFRFIKN